MARDYRYGHKTKKVQARRTQQQKDVIQSAVPAQAITALSQPELLWVGEKDRRKVEGENLGRRASDPAHKPSNTAGVSTTADVSPPNAQESVGQKGRRIRRQSTADRSVEMQRIVDAACRLSLPKAIRKEAEEKEALARQQAEVLAAEQAKAQQQAQLLAQQKKQTRVSWGLWGSLTLIIFSGIAWLLYAPFFLAFALKMNWIDEATRNRLDPAAALRSQVVASLPQSVQQGSAESTLVKKLEPVSVQQQSGVTYSFYHELPKAKIVTGAQPLPVRTRSPTYLQLVSMSNEQDAQTERKRLAQKGYLVQMNAQVMKGQNVYVLRMGPYEDQRIINRLKVELQRLGIDAHEISVASVVKAIERQLPEMIPVAPSRGEMQQHQKTTP